MNDGKALLAAILENPACDTARLVYADWLDEQGDKESRERAEFVRVQCRLAGLRREYLDGNVCEKCFKPTHWYVYTPRCRGSVCRLRQREYYTSRRYVVWDWTRGIPPGSRPVYTRGFVSHVTCTQTEFIRHAAGMFSAHPITSVSLGNVVAAEIRVEYPGAPTIGRVRWCFWSVAGVPEVVAGGGLTCELWDLMQAREKTMNFLSPGNADEALSRTCVAYGRRLAGLSSASTPA